MEYLVFSIKYQADFFGARASARSFVDVATKL